MVFPVESEDRTMRNLLMLCQDHARLIVEGFRYILKITDALSKNQAVTSEPMGDIQKLINETNTIKNTLIKELNDIGGVLVSRDDFFRLISNFGDIMDHIKGIGARFSEIEKRGWIIPEETGKAVLELSDQAFDSLIKLREAIMSLGFNSEKAVGFTKQIDDIEKKFDEDYVKVEVSIITSGMDLPAMLLLKDSVYLMEDLVDEVRDASDTIRIIAL
jgi:uncharacterized protein Yka (UPF0111/DUF47 family)